MGELTEQEKQEMFEALQEIFSSSSEEVIISEKRKILEVVAKAYTFYRDEGNESEEAFIKAIVAGDKYIDERHGQTAYWGLG